MAKSSHRIRIHAAPDRVYQALTSEGGLKAWFTPHVDVEGGVREGGEVKMSFSGKEPFRWKFSQFKPQTHVHWTCLEGPGAAAGTSVTYILNDEGNSRTLLEFDHDGWPEGHEALATCNTLWGVLMGRLKDFAETGKANPAFS